MDAIGNVLLDLVNAIERFFVWIYDIVLRPIVEVLLYYIPRHYLIGGIVIVIMMLILLRVGLKQK